MYLQFCLRILTTLSILLTKNIKPHAVAKESWKPTSYSCVGSTKRIIRAVSEIILFKSNFLCRSPATITKVAIKEALMTEGSEYETKANKITMVIRTIELATFGIENIRRRTTTRRKQKGK